LWIILLSLGGVCSASDLAILQNGFSIRHERREVMGVNTRLFLSENGGYIDVPTVAIERFERDLSHPAAAAPAPTPSLEEVIGNASQRHRLDPALIQSVIHAESGFNTRAVSSKGAQGLMQLMPQTASQLGVSNSFDPQANVEGGTRYLRELLERYNFDLVKALAAYNAGPGRVEKYRGVPPYYETRAYVARIIREYNQKKAAEKKVVVAKTSSAKKTRPTVVSSTAPSASRQELSR
jgi:soluble lytic murein transglycosylase-like protein